MKIKFITILLFFSTLRLFSQASGKIYSHGLAYNARPSESLSISIKDIAMNTSRSGSLSAKFKNYYILDKEKIPNKSEEIYQLNLEIVLPDGRRLNSDLDRTYIAKPGSKCYIQGEAGIIETDLKISPTFSGQIKGLNESKVFLMLSDAYFVCVADINEKETYVIEPLIEDGGIMNSSKLLFYKASDITNSKIYKCLAEDVHLAKANIQAESSMAGCYELDIAQAADFSMFQKYGNADGVNGRMAAIIGLSQPNFENSFNSKIYLRIAGTWISNCSSCDPWNGTSDINDLQIQFRDWSFRDNNFLNINHDLSQLWSNREFNGFVGWATIKAICVFDAKQVIRDYTNDLDYLRCTVSHELGHSFGATHDGDGIMLKDAARVGHWSSKSKNEINPYINELINNKCLFPCTPYHFEYAKIAEEGFRFRHPYQILEQTKFYECEPIWRYWSIDQISPNITIQGKSELILPDGQKDIYDINSNSGSEILYWKRWMHEFLPTQLGQHIWNFYQKADNGELCLMSSKKFEVIQKPTNSICSERLYLDCDGNINDKSSFSNHPIPRNGSVGYDKDRFGNCNSAIRLGNGTFLEAPVINERAISFWFKVNLQEQMVIYDGGPNGMESWDLNISIYKPGGLGAQANFDNTYGIFFDTWDRDIAVPFDAVKSGWHFVSISRDISSYNHFRIMIDGQFPPGYFYDGYETVRQWFPQNSQPFVFPDGGYGVPNLHDYNYKSYIGKESKDEKIWGTGLSYFDGWLDDIHIFGQLLDENEMMALYKAQNSSPLKASVTSNTGSCSGQNNGSLTVTSNGGSNISYKWSNGGTTQTINNLAPGTYTCTITGVVSANCIHTTTVSATVSSFSRPVISISSTNGSCKNQSNGNALISVSSGTAPYQYKWSNNQTTSTLSNVSAGNYTVTVSDANGCFSSHIVNVAELPQPTLWSSNINNECSGQKDGSVLIAIGGGKSPYVYKWSNGQTSEKLSNVGYGDYLVTVTDANGCSAAFAFKVKEKEQINNNFSISISKNEVQYTNLTTNANRYFWNFGDGNNSIEFSPKHTYNKSGHYIVCLTAYGCDSITFCKDITINPGVATKDMSKSGLVQIYPNPAQDVLYVKTNQGFTVHHMEIYDFNGKLVSRNLSAGNKESILQISTAELVNGVYVLKIYSGQDVYAGRFSVMK
ncbi:MAG: T9SS type A sorting domain-containing protein [Saprospiraceae bacterium]|nr:T9SS type A sorting domain-containing protein [Saprospiraceae bacterium]MBK7796548.1 T9SS type A sorting domain-containing protein [Saprospiraceae bacterium]MBL0260062.1 T9SS type A sorting domain-containing protein [Saprospiraceae bacterium]